MSICFSYSAIASELFLKGFYGKPVFYDLTCAEFKSAFQSETGNYVATARLVGFSFALISDVSLCSLMAAPLSSYKGKEYWSSCGFNIDGHPMPTFYDLLLKWQQHEKQVQQLVQNYQTELQNKQEEVVNAEKSQQTLELIETKFKGTDLNSVFSYNKSSHVITLKKECVSKLEEGKLKFEHPEIYSWLETVDGKLSESLNNDGATFKNLFESITAWTQTNGVYTYSIGNIITALKSAKDSAQKFCDNFEETVKTEISNQVSQIFGFRPTIYNLSKMCFAHLETLLYMFDQVGKTSKDKSKLFPAFYTESVVEGKKRWEETWPGSLSAEVGREEVKMVKGIVDGIKLAVPQLAQSGSTSDGGSTGVSDSSSSSSSSSSSVGDIARTNIMDAFLPHPFESKFKSKFSAFDFLSRYFKICQNQTLYGYCNETYASKAGAQDALWIKKFFKGKGWPNMATDLKNMTVTSTGKVELFNRVGNPTGGQHKFSQPQYGIIRESKASSFKNKKYLNSKGEETSFNLKFSAPDGNYFLSNHNRAIYINNTNKTFSSKLYLEGVAAKEDVKKSLFLSDSYLKADLTKRARLFLYSFFIICIVF